MGRGRALPDEDLFLFRLFVSLCAGEIEPSVGLDVVLGNSLADRVHDSQGVLGIRLSLLGSLAPPEYGAAEAISRGSRECW